MDSLQNQIISKPKGKCHVLPPCFEKGEALTHTLRVSLKNHFKDNPEYFKIDAPEFMYEVFHDACIRHNDSHVILCEMASTDGESQYMKAHDAHRIRNIEHRRFVKEKYTHYTPVLYKNNGKYSGKGIRGKELATCAVLIGVDCDSLAEFERADKIRRESGGLDWDFALPTGGRGVQAGWILDAYPLRTERQKEYFENVLTSTVEFLGSDKKAKLLTQLLRLPDTKHPRTGKKSVGFIRNGFKEDTYGKLSRIASWLKKNGALKSTPIKGQSRIEKCEEYRKEIWERLGQGFLSGKHGDLAKGFGISEKQFTSTITKWKKEGRVNVSLLRNGQRNAGVKIEKIVSTIPSDTDTLRVHCASESFSLRQKVAWVLSEYLKKGALENYRNTLLFSMAVISCAMRENVHKAREKLRAGNLKSAIPLSESEFQRTFDSGFSGKYGGVEAYWLNECVKGLGVNSTGEKINQSDFALADFKNENVINFTEARARKERQEKPKADFHFFDGKSAERTKTLTDTQGREIAKAFSTSGDVIYRVRGYYANSYRQHWYKWLYPSDKDYLEIHEFWGGQEKK